MKGLAPDGGLFVPDEMPHIDKAFLDELKDMDYMGRACSVLRLFLTDYDDEEIKGCVERAYGGGKFDTVDIAPVMTDCSFPILELWHGPTSAFKDMALQLLPQLMTTAMKKTGEKSQILILAATSGDTGKAALAGFADVPGTRIIVFYPKNGVSPIQEKQMVTQKGKNTYVVAIRGNFDDAQTGVKKMFGDKELAKEMQESGFQFSSANSINIGRLVPQVVYYVYAYAKLRAAGELAENEPINVVVPTGNFGNILAAYYAKNMGVPIAKLICASNDNKVLYDFFQTGEYNRNREFILTTSPSMDILISSNLERLIYKIAGEDAVKNAEMMKSLTTEGKYEITPKMRERLQDFTGGFATEKEVSDEIARVYQDTGYVMDTHTAVASCVYHKYQEQSGDQTKTVIASTASPYKFTRSVMDALHKDSKNMTDFELVDELSRISGVKVPAAIEEIRTAPVLHDTVVETAEMKNAVKKILGVK